MRLTSAKALNDIGSGTGCGDTYNRIEGIYLPGFQVFPGLRRAVFRVFNGFADSPVASRDQPDHPIRRGAESRRYLGGIEHPEPAVPKPLPHEGLTYRFPFDTEKKTYAYFDPIAQKPFDANYDGEDDVNGLTTYRFTQNVGYDADGKLVEPIKYASLYDKDEDGEVTARAALWGLPGDPYEPITMTRYYAAKRTFWVDPVSGTIVKSEEHANHYYARDPLRPETTMADYTVTSAEATVESQVASARDERDRIALWSRILPITFTAAGLIALVAGALLGSFGVRAEVAAQGPESDSDGGGFFAGRRDADTGPMPAAEAETEKLPTQRPDLQSDQGSS